MRIVYVSTIERGGPLTHVLQLVPRVAEAGVEVEVLCATDALAGRFRELGIRAEPSGKPPEEPGEARSQRDHDVLVAGVAANLEYWKGIDILLEAARLVRVPLRLEIYGDGSLREELELQARESGIDVRFHGFTANMHDRIAELDVLVQPSRADNLPLAILEAMSAGVPVVGARVGGIPELVADGETGFVVEAENPRALADALEQLSETPERRREFGRKGLERVQQHFSSAGVAQRMVELYEDVCASST